MRKKMIASFGAAVVIAGGGTLLGATVASAAGGDDHQATEAGYPVCVNPDSSIKRNAIYPNDAAHPLVCHGGSHLYSWLTKQDVNGHFRHDEAALKSAIAAVGAPELESSRNCTPSLCVGENPEGPQGLGGSAGWGWDSAANAPVTAVKVGASASFNAEVDQHGPAAVVPDGDITLTWNPQFLKLMTSPTDGHCTMFADSTGATCHFTDLAHAATSKPFVFQGLASTVATAVNVTVDAGGQQATGRFPIAVQ